MIENNFWSKQYSNELNSVKERNSHGNCEMNFHGIYAIEDGTHDIWSQYK